MAKTKPKDQKTTLSSWAEVDNCLQDIAIQSNKVKEIEADMNSAIINLQEKYQPKLNELNSEIMGIEKNIELFCLDHKEEFGGKKTKELNYGLVSFRTGTPKLATLKGFTWDAVKNLVKATKKYAVQFIRIKEDLDKQGILASGMKNPELAKIGVHIVQEESFGYEVYYKESKGVA